MRKISRKEALEISHRILDKAEKARTQLKDNFKLPKVYRIKHLDSGLYYCPSRLVLSNKNTMCKSNLSKQGKVYTKRPCLDWVSLIYSHLNPGVLIETKYSDWEIEVKLLEDL